MHALIFDKSVHCAGLSPIYGFCTVCQICYCFCVTCLFWFNVLGEWILVWVSKFVPYRDIAITLWKSNFEWSSSWNGFLIYQNNTVQKSTFCHCALCHRDGLNPSSFVSVMFLHEPSWVSLRCRGVIVLGISVLGFGGFWTPIQAVNS